jgi:outer membrane protein OmpA-like peptidoglycan-associated protein
MNKIAASVVGLIALTGCSSNDPVYSSFFREAGSVVDGGTFGAATMNNNLVQTGQREYAVSLHRRFEAQVPTTINFAFNSTALDEQARAVLRAQADFIRQFPEVTFRVYGHTDLVGSAAYNRRLGLRRAQAVVLYLESQGISRDRLEAVVSHGETQPLIVTEGRERANRRTVTEVSGFVENNSMVLNGRYAEVIFREYVASGTQTTGVTSLSGGELSTSQ